MSSTADLSSRIRHFTNSYDDEDYFYSLAFHIVKWKFPNVSTRIYDHLAASIKFRRQSHRYWLQQQRKLEHPPVYSIVFEVPKSRTSQTAGLTLEVPGAHRRPISSASYTSASSFEVQDFHRNCTEPSCISNKSLSSHSPVSTGPMLEDFDSLPYPQPPKIEGGAHAFCNMCFREHSGRSYKDNSWWR